MNETNVYSNPLDLLVENIMDIARENRIDDARIYIKDRIEKDAIAALQANAHVQYRPDPALEVEQSQTRIALKMFQKAMDENKKLRLVLNDSRRAIASLPKDALGHDCEDGYFYTDELLRQIDKILAL